jgi:hypothetical protein
MNLWFKKHLPRRLAHVLIFAKDHEMVKKKVKIQ